MTRIKLLAVAALFITAAALSATPSHAARRHRVDCKAVMTLLGGGKKPKAVARQLGISRSSVYRCRRKAAAKRASHS